MLWNLPAKLSRYFVAAALLLSQESSAAPGYFDLNFRWFLRAAGRYSPTPAHCVTDGNANRISTVGSSGAAERLGGLEVLRGIGMDQAKERASAMCQ